MSMLVAHCDFHAVRSTLLYRLCLDNDIYSKQEDSIRGSRCALQPCVQLRTLHLEASSQTRDITTEYSQCASESAAVNRGQRTFSAGCLG